MGAFTSVKTTETRLAFAEQFLASAWPQAVVHISYGCLKVLTNRAHETIASGSTVESFDGSPMDFVDALWEIEARIDEGGGNPNLAGYSCYCELIRAIDVLDISHCELYRLWKRCQASQQVVETGLDYLLTASNGHRDYRVNGVPGRSLGGDILAISCLPHQATIQVENAMIGSQRGLSAWFCGERRFVMFPQRSEAKVYYRFLEGLVDVEQLLNQGEQDKAHGRLNDLEENYPAERYTVRNVVRDLQENLTLEAIEQRRASIFDYEAVRHATQSPIGEWLGPAKHLLEQTAVPDGFDYVFRPSRYFSGAEWEQPALSLLDRVVATGSLSSTMQELLTEAERGMLDKLTSEKILHLRQEEYSLTAKGHAALRLREEAPPAPPTPDPLAEIIDRLQLKPLREARGQVQADVDVEMATVLLQFDGEPPVTIRVDRTRLESIRRSQPGSPVLYRYYEVGGSAVSVFSPADE